MGRCRSSLRGCIQTFKNGSRPRLYAFKDQLSKAGSEAELAEAEQRVDEIFKSELEKHARGDAEATDTGALGLTMQQLTNAIAQRRVALAGGDRPVPQA